MQDRKTKMAPIKHGWLAYGAALILERSSWIVAFIVIVSFTAATQVTQLKFGNSLVEIFLDDPQEYQQSLEWNRIFGGSSDNVIYIGATEGGDLFTPEKLSALRHAAQKLASIPEVADAISFVDLPSVSPFDRLSLGETAARAVARKQILGGIVPDGSLRRRLYWPSNAASQKKVDIAELRKSVLADERAVGTLVSEDGDSWAIVLRLVDDSDLSIFRQIELYDDIVQAVRQNGLGDKGVHAVGTVVTQSWLFREMLRGVYWICPLVLMAISLTVYVIFRHVIPVVIALTIAIMSTLWAIGFTIFWFGDVGLLVVAAAPPIIITIATSDFIHLTSTYRTELESGRTMREALERTIVDVGGACIMTALTTLIGFASLATVPVPAPRHFAIASGVGVISALILQSLGPIVYLSLKVRLQSSTQQRAKSDGLIDRTVAGCRYVSRRFPYVVIASCIVLIVLATIAARGLTVSADFPYRFPASHPLRIATNFFEQSFSGSSNIELVVVLESEKASSVEFLTRLQSVENKLLAMRQVHAVHSVLLPLRVLSNYLRIESPSEILPTQSSVESALQLISKNEPNALKGFISPSLDMVRIYVRVEPTDFLEVARLATTMEVALQKEFPSEEGLLINAAGTMTTIGNCVERIVDNQLRGNWICAIVITIVMAFSLGSIRVGLLSQVPNLVPLAILIGLIALFFKRIDSDVLGLPMIALGIAVDDTIHFLHRYRLQLESETESAALDSTFHFTGRAVVQSAMILCIGLAPCALSNYLGVRMIGTLLVFTFACGLLADLLLVPAMIQTKMIRWRKP